MAVQHDDLPINLDGYMDPTEVEEIGQVFQTLANYAKLKARAMRDRAKGNIQEALFQEQTCERYYKTLPAWARW